MAAALTLLGVIEAGRRPMAVVLLGGTVFLTLGRGLATSALLAGTPARAAAVRPGSHRRRPAALALAALVDAGRPRRPGPAGPDGRRPSRSLLPHLALLTAAVDRGTVALHRCPAEPRDGRRHRPLRRPRRGAPRG